MGPVPWKQGAKCEWALYGRLTLWVWYEAGRWHAQCDDADEPGEGEAVWNSRHPTRAMARAAAQAFAEGWIAGRAAR